jgi:predicted DNA-binding protein (UPF0251 family)
MPKFDKETLLKVIQAKYGNMTHIANAMQVSRTTVWHWVNEDEELKLALKEARESMVDFLESQFYLKVRGIPKIEKNKKTGKEEVIGWEVPPDSYLIKFGLSTQGRDRGWTERREVDITTNGESIKTPFTIIFTTEDDDEQEDTIE